MEPKEVLAKAAEYMAERGHNKGCYEAAETGAVCVYGAMTLAVTEGETGDFARIWGPKHALVEQAASLLGVHLYPGFRVGGAWWWFPVVTDYNDGKNTTKEDMVLALKRAAHGD